MQVDLAERASDESNRSWSRLNAAALFSGLNDADLTSGLILWFCHLWEFRC